MTTKQVEHSTTHSTTTSKKEESPKKEEHSTTHTAASVPSSSKNPESASLTNIKLSLSNSKLRDDFTDNIADLASQYSRRKLTAGETAELKNIAEQMVSKIFKVTKLG